MITIKEIQKHFDDVTVKDGDMGEYAEIRILRETYIHVPLTKGGLNAPELYKGQVWVCLLLGVNTIEDLKTLHRLIMS